MSPPHFPSFRETSPKMTNPLNLMPRVPLLSTIINGRSVPTGAWNIDALVETKYTPDVQRLFSKDSWHVFMYDDYPIEELTRAVAFTNENYLLYRQKENDGLVALAANEKDVPLVSRPAW